MFKMAFRVVHRIRRRCSRHPAYNPWRRQWKIPSEAINKRVSSNQATSAEIASPKLKAKNRAPRLESL
jgi:hypothetical protein